MKSNQSTTSAPYPLRWTALFLLCIAQFIVIMDTSIIGVALPAIQSDLGYSQTGLQWIFNAYVIFFGGFLLLGGKLSDLIGARKTFMWGFALLTLASLFAGVAWSDSALNTARALQGLGSAFIAPAALTMVMTMFTDPQELGKAFGYWGAAAAAGGSAGVFLGGVITEWMSWEWIFLINIPIGLFVLIQSPKVLQKGTTQKGSVDMSGAIMATSALVLMVYAIVSAESAGWLSYKTLGLLLVAVVLFSVFLVSQGRKKEPLLPLSIFKVPNLSAGNIITALLAGSWIPLWFYLNLYLQQVLHYTAFNSGLALLPMTLVIMIVMVGFTGKLVVKFGFKANLIAGLLFLTASLVLFSLVPVEGSFVTHVLPASLLGAVGMSLAYIPSTMAAMSGAKPEEMGLASGLVNTSYQIGSALGLAVIVVIAAAKTSSVSTVVASPQEGLVAGFQTAFTAAAVLSGLATLMTVFSIKTSK
ncbi:MULTISPECIES: DHA2 family efflux MFS transporter permease subunit [Flavobacterium]|uniref:MFS transporter n=1 Tax=Flavobacterium sedimenticola TaxID=3043286 RepID=A0ABT6XQ34_9FLAO|nr:DHA2 family efflux MFS transporter permease subunit [Flavobacterium sedimenticola]MDI9256774.1 MFS transporter [Flavobacterium sedimenticola]